MTLICLGVKCVVGELVASNLTVPSLKIVKSYLCLNNPFSIDSQYLYSLKRALTPFSGFLGK